jgi:hypothetical protein
VERAGTASPAPCAAEWKKAVAGRFAKALRENLPIPGLEILRFGPM